MHGASCKAFWFLFLRNKNHNSRVFQLTQDKRLRKPRIRRRKTAFPIKYDCARYIFYYIYIPTSSKAMAQKKFCAKSHDLFPNLDSDIPTRFRSITWLNSYFMLSFLAGDGGLIFAENLASLCRVREWREFWTQPIYSELGKPIRYEDTNLPWDYLRFPPRSIQITSKAICCPLTVDWLAFSQPVATGVRCRVLSPFCSKREEFTFVWGRQITGQKQWSQCRALSVSGACVIYTMSAVWCGKVQPLLSANKRHVPSKRPSPRLNILLAYLSQVSEQK